MMKRKRRREVVDKRGEAHGGKRPRIRWG